MSDAYDAFADDYEWLYSDPRRIGEEQAQALAPWTDVDPRPSILDCACGTGRLALALARQGLEVMGADASAGMVARAEANAAREEIDLRLEVCAWQALSRRFEGEFDLVVCGGNSIGHCVDEADMARALDGMRAVLRSGGHVVVDTRDWEQLLAERVRFTCFGPRGRDGMRCLPLYVWSFGRDVRDPVVVEVVLPIETEEGVRLRSHRITYQPFTVRQLTERMERAGFLDVRTETRLGGLVRFVGRAP